MRRPDPDRERAEVTPLELAQRVARLVDDLDVVASLRMRIAVTDRYLDVESDGELVTVSEDHGGEYGRPRVQRAVEAGPVSRYLDGGGA